MNRISKYLILFLLSFVVFSCNEDRKEDSTNKNSLSEIKKRGMLRAVTDNNSTSYFIYRGTPMGFQYELLKEYANFIGVNLEIVLSNDLDEKFSMLKRGEVDIIAVNLTITQVREYFMDFTESHGSTRQVLVQRLPENLTSIPKNERDNYLVKIIDSLNGKSIFVQEKSVFVANLEKLKNKYDININIVDRNPYGVEELVFMVSEGKIDFTVCDEDVAKINSTFLQNIDVETALSDEENLAWAVKTSNDSLKLSINEWLLEFKKTKKFASIYYKYFQNPKYKKMLSSDYYSLSGGKISQYDDIIKELCKETYWDWRLVSSLIYHESNFDNSVRSWAGAAGLMQLMPQTARAYGISIDAGPISNISAGIKVINSLDKLFVEEVTDTLERIKFILASYNIGPGHVLDAQRLAEKYGKDPNKWDNNVDSFLLLKSKPKYYRDSVVRSGYCRGNETFKFVKKVLDVYGHYQNLISE